MEINRYPKTKDKSLRAWNAADEYILSHLEESGVCKDTNCNLAIYNDRFGYMTTYLNPSNPLVVANAYSQQKSIEDNLIRNSCETGIKFIDPLKTLDHQLDIALINIPKSVDLLEHYLMQITQNCSENCIVICGFMTKYFSKNYLAICSQYFENVEQTKAKKKARLILLSKPKKVEKKDLIRSIEYQLPATDHSIEFKQYYGVFSSKHIDYATQLLLENIRIDDIRTDIEEMQVLDLGCGNGIIASYIQLICPSCKLSLLDDSFLAIESAKLNIEAGNTTFVYHDGLESFKEEQFDLILTNPPFHFEHETNFEITLGLFQGAYRCLNPTGKLIIVANRHLNYSTHLKSIFGDIGIVAQNEKYEVIECWKT